MCDLLSNELEHFIAGGDELNRELTLIYTFYWYRRDRGIQIHSEKRACTDHTE